MGSRGRGETVIGEEGSRKGKHGGGEALEAPGEHMVHPLPLHYTLCSPPASLPLFPSSLALVLLAAVLRTARPITFSFF